MGRSYSSVALLYSIDANDSYFFALVNKILLGGVKVPFLRALCVIKDASFSRRLICQILLTSTYALINSTRLQTLPSRRDLSVPGNTSVP